VGRSHRPVALAELRRAGVDVLVSLLPAEQAAGLGLEAAAAAAGLAFRSFPIPDFGVPDRVAAEPELAALARALATGRHVAVHCWGGVGRSSLVAAAVLVRTGVAPVDAWARAAAARGLPVPTPNAPGSTPRPRRPAAGRRCPETRTTPRSKYFPE